MAALSADALRVTLAAAQADLGVDARTVDPTTDGARLVRLDAVRAVVDEAGQRHRVLLLPTPAGRAAREVVVDGWRFLLLIEPERHAALRDRARRGRAAIAAGGPAEVRAVIPGRVLEVVVAPGDTVEVGQRLFVVEAMKMQNELRSPRAGTVRQVAVRPGQTIELGDLLAVLE